MGKRFEFSLAPLLATAALVVMPAAALAETPHYTSNGPNIGTEPVTTVAWGAVTLKGTKGGTPGSFFTCRIAAAGTAENPGGGNPATDKTPGQGSIQAFVGAVGTCEQEGFCAPGEKPVLGGVKLPWTSTLEIAGGVIRQAITGVKLAIGCKIGEKQESNIRFATNPASVCCKSLHPPVRKGTSALHPAFLEFGGLLPSGELEGVGPQEGEEFGNEAVRVSLEGELKVLGLAEQELINAKKDPA